MESKLLQKLKYASQLTAQEKHIVDYILNNPEVVFDSTAHELAQQTYTSSSTIVRLCKKLGTKGYPDFQLKLAVQNVFDGFCTLYFRHVYMGSISDTY
ncbi:MurR/RpiR family transcriptional regulator [Paenibacillus sp. Z3-2]